MDLKNMSMSELIARYNTIAPSKGVGPQTEFKNLAAARAAITDLENRNMDTPSTNPATPAATPPLSFQKVAGGPSIEQQIANAVASADAGTAPTGTADGTNKYSTVGKRGPNQGIGEFAKGLLSAGMPTADVLTKVREQFPTAKTSPSCIAYYKAALKNPNLGKKKAAVDPAALRAKAQELMNAATAAENAAVEAAKQQAAQAAQQAAQAQAAAQQAAQLAAAQQAALAAAANGGQPATPATPQAQPATQPAAQPVNTAAM